MPQPLPEPQQAAPHRRPNPSAAPAADDPNAAARVGRHARGDAAAAVELDALDRALINRLQDGFPLSDRPYAEVARALGSDEATVIARLKALLDAGLLSRFGPMFHAERLGGGLSLVAMAVPDERFDSVADQVNAHPEVAHNYARDHHLNMWFVLATEREADVARVLAAIEAETGLPTYNCPKLQEFYVGLRIEV